MYLLQYILTFFVWNERIQHVIVLTACTKQTCMHGGTCEEEVCICTAFYTGSSCSDRRHNWALKQRATQSSTKRQSKAHNAIDGSLHNCAETRKVKNPWWKVNLGHILLVQDVIIQTVDKDAGARPNDYVITISKYHGREWTCGSHRPNIFDGEVMYFKCRSGVKGSIVKIALHATEYLVLCKVTVFGERANTLNWALNQKATHSSTQGNLGADKAVDGNYDGYYPACSETKKSTNPWWQVQLENEIEVQEVTIINRADCCGNRLHDAHVSVKSMKGYIETCFQDTGPLATGINVSYVCYKELIGVSVQIQVPGYTEILALCEVEIYGIKGFCRSNPCLNGGFCDVTGDSYYCNCQNQHFGPHCEHFNACLSNPCMNGGSCDGYGIDYKCTCRETYTGSNCNLFTTCDDNPCENGATCKQGEQYGECICPIFYSCPVCADIEKNWALKQKVAQSTTLIGYQADYAVDGIADIGINSAYSQTDTEDAPWWKVYLQHIMLVHEVAILNCGGNKLHDFDITIGHYHGKTHTCGPQRNHMTTGETRHIICGADIKGSVVKITMYARGHLSLCEVAVHGTRENTVNWALGRPTKQSDTFKKQHSDKAVDGIYDAYFPSCAETKPGSRDRWWKTRLLHEIEVQEVVVTNRDDCCEEHHHDIRISAIRINGNAMVCVQDTGIVPLGSTMFYICDKEVLGLYVKIEIQHGKPLDRLTLCEVEVYGIEDYGACWSYPCQNGGTCDMDNEPYTCECASGYFGYHCENFNACWSSPCMHDGVCQRIENSYKCSCWESSTGINCETSLCSCLEKMSDDLRTCILLPKIIFPIHIRCVQNCGSPASTIEKLGLIVECGDCAVSSAYSYTWDTNATINWMHDTGTGRNSWALSVKADVLKVDQVYMFGVRVLGGPCSRKEAYETHILHTSPPPTKGNCSIEPTIGMAGETKFTVMCEGFYDTLQPLTYIFVFKTAEQCDPDLQDKLLATSQEPGFHDKTLPIGNSEANYNATIEVQIRNSIGETTSLNIGVTILPGLNLEDMSFDDMFSLFKSEPGKPSMLERLMASGRVQEALGIMSSLASNVRHAATKTNARYNERKRSEFYGELVKVLKTVKVTDATTVGLKVQCLNDATSGDDDLNDDSKFAAADMYEEMAGFLLDQTTGSKDGKDDVLGRTSAFMEKAEKDIFTGSLNIMSKTTGETDMVEVVTGTLDDIEDEYTLKRQTVAKSVVNKTMNVVDLISDVALSRQVPGEKERVLNANGFALTLQKDTAFHMSNKTVPFPMPGYGDVKLPNFATGSKGSLAAYEYLNMKVFQSASNMFAWHKSSRNVTTDVIDLIINHGNRSRETTVQFKDAVIIAIPETVIGECTHVAVDMAVEQETISNRDINHVNFNIEFKRTYQITFTLSAVLSHTSFFLVVKTNTYALVNDFFGAPNSRAPAALMQLNFGEGKQTETVFSVKYLTLTQTALNMNKKKVVVHCIVTSDSPSQRLYLGLLPSYYDTARCRKCKKESTKCGFCNSRFRNATLRQATRGIIYMDICTRMQDCLHWDPIEEAWTNTACKVSRNTRAGFVVCECRHMSVFAGSFLVAPNKVDLFKLTMFLGVFHNPIVISLLIASWCIFIIMSVWARRRDRKDYLKGNLFVLMDNEDESKYYYLVTVMTGLRKGGGTSAAIVLCIAGNWACTKFHVFYDPDNCLFEAGSESWFLLAAKQSLGDLRTVTVWHSCTGVFPKWFLNQITVRDCQTNKHWSFVCNDWLTPEIGTHSIKRTLLVYNKSDLQYRFLLKAVQSARDQHIWVSLFLHPPHSLFTRVQRLACAMSFIMGSMVTNIMFYGQRKSDDEIELSDSGNYKITLQQFIIAMESIAITLPINMIMVTIFRKLQPRAKTHAKKTYGKNCCCYYAGWFLALSSSIIATYVTAMYSLEYGYVASVSWTISFFTGFFSNVGLIQPLKVTIMAAVMSFFFESHIGPVAPAAYFVTLVNETDYIANVRKQQRFERQPPKYMYRLPEPAHVKLARRRLEKEHKMWRTIEDTAVGMALLALVLAIAYGSTNCLTYCVNKSIRDTFVTARYSGELEFTEVKTRDDIWRYIEDTMLHSFHYNNTKYTADETNILIGSAIVRQVRVHSESSRCKPPHIPCYDSQVEDTKSYKSTWNMPITNDSVENPYSAWSYQSDDALQIGSIGCQHRTYPGGGYVVAIRKDKKRMTRLLRGLHDAEWLDNNTRGVLIQFTTFNPKLNEFTIALLAFEFVCVGVIEPYHDIVTHRLHNLTNLRDFVTIMCQICYIILIILYIIQVGRTMVAHRVRVREYVFNVWTYIDWAIVVLTYAAVIVFVLRVMAIRRAVESAKKHVKRYVSFQEAGFYDSSFTNILAAVITMFVLKTLKLMYFNKHSLMKTSTLTRHFKLTAVYSVGIAVTIVLVLASMTCLFGASCLDYSRFTTSLMSTTRMIVFKPSLRGVGNINGTQLVDIVFLGVLVFVLLPWMILVILSLLTLSMPCNRRSSVVEENIDFIDFFISRLFLMLGFWNMTQYSEHMDKIMQ